MHMYFFIFLIVDLDCSMMIHQMQNTQQNFHHSMASKILFLARCAYTVILMIIDCSLIEGITFFNVNALLPLSFPAILLSLPFSHLLPF